MARNNSSNFSDDDDYLMASEGGSLDAEFTESGTAGLQSTTDEGLFSEGIAQQQGQAATQTRTQQTTAQSQQADLPTSMHDKRGNQPR
jgi:hypothetical protein